jgi:FKBP-type peptidyl-prolyl cis-trans isomerase
MLRRTVVAATLLLGTAHAFHALPPPSGTRGHAEVATRMCGGAGARADAKALLHRRRRGAGAAMLSTLLLAPLPSIAARAQNAKWAKRSGEFTSDELEDFEENESGLQWKELQAGWGSEVSKKGEKVVVHYSAYELGSGNLVDSSYERGEPITFVVGTGSVMAALDEALLGMEVGARRVLILPAATQAFGVASPLNFILTQLDDSCQHAHFKPDVCPTGKLGFVTKGVGPIPPGSQLVFYIERLALGT